MGSGVQFPPDLWKRVGVTLPSHLVRSKAGPRAVRSATLGLSPTALLLSGGQDRGRFEAAVFTAGDPDEVLLFDLASLQTLRIIPAGLSHQQLEWHAVWSESVRSTRVIEYSSGDDGGRLLEEVVIGHSVRQASLDERRDALLDVFAAYRNLATRPLELIAHREPLAFEEAAGQSRYPKILREALSSLPDEWYDIPLCFSSSDASANNCILSPQGPTFIDCFPIRVTSAVEHPLECLAGWDSQHALLHDYLEGAFDGALAGFFPNRIPGFTPRSRFAMLLRSLFKKPSSDPRVAASHLDWLMESYGLLEPAADVYSSDGGS